VTDDQGDVVTLPAPARHIVSLAPHTTELLFAAGAGDQIVATVRYADYPPAAQKLPKVGDSQLLDLERIAALKPDLIVVWMHGNATQQIERLRALGLPIFHSEPHKIVDVADSLRRLGKLAGTDAQAEAAVQAFEAEHRRLRDRGSSTRLFSTVAARATIRERFWDDHPHAGDPLSDKDSFLFQARDATKASQESRAGASKRCAAEPERREDRKEPRKDRTEGEETTDVGMGRAKLVISLEGVVTPSATPFLRAL